MIKLTIILWQLIALVLAALIFTRVNSHDQSGFISIDCGISTSYDDDTTGLQYVPDTDYINSGVSKPVAPKYSDNILKHFDTIRSFPEGTRNCYTLNPLQAEAGKFLIRAQFMYGNYDLKSNLPEFDLYIGVNWWNTVILSEFDDIFTSEMIHTPTENMINVCLVNKGLGTPFISVLELRPMGSNNIYNSSSGSLTLYGRLNVGTDSTNSYRYDYDIYDRTWKTKNWTSTRRSIETSQTVTPNSYNLPYEVISTAVTPINPLNPIDFYLTSVIPGQEYYIYLHFAEIEELATDEFRGFDLYLNNSKLHGPIIPPAFTAYTLFSSYGFTAENSLNFSLRMTANSTLPPILNALEVYELTDTSQLETDTRDAQAMENIKSTYNVSKIWQGDPCAPRNYSWDGLSCIFSSNETPRIISMNLSSSNLNGEISKYISGLTMLQKLDLSNNSLFGNVPSFLQDLSSLKFLDLSGNNLSGSIPAYLAQKSKAGTLILNVEGNQHLCLSTACNNTTPSDENLNKKKSHSLIPIIATILGALVVIIVALYVVFCILRSKKTQEASKETVTSHLPTPLVKEVRDTIETRNQKFTYSDVLSITNNLTRVIGRGGFGTVYHGYMDDVQVAVKMLAPSSSQGYKEFKAEAQLLMIVHHRNLTSLVGYCDEGDKMGLIYEFMSQGDLYSHISDYENPQHLTWEERLHISLDAAQGLEYLHNGCKPPIVHRDIKSTNILLNDRFEAKLADFGLSRACQHGVGRQTDIVPTAVAGTPGYLDPEYYHTQQLHETSDVFSFGIVLLEVITSKPVMINKVHISKWVSQILSTQGDVKAILDPRLRGGYDINSAWKFVELAMTCVSVTSDKRPTMSQVVNELSQCLSMEKTRKCEGFTNDTLESVEMLNLGREDVYVPLAR